jgi:polar amino acid transport system substrate-binding protein
VPPHVAATGPTVDRIRHAGVFRVAADLSYPPMAFRTNGAPAGFDAELAALLAGALGVRSSIVDTPETVMHAGVPGDADAAIGALPPGSVPGLSSAPYYTSRQAIVSPARAAIRSIQGLRGIHVQVAVGSPGVAVVQDAGAIPDLTYLSAQALAAVTEGRARAAIADAPAATGYAADHAGLWVSGEVGAATPWVIVVPNDAKDLAEFVAAALRALERDGGLAQLRARWHL